MPLLAYQPGFIALLMIARSAVHAAAPLSHEHKRGQRRERNFHSNPAFSRVRVLRRERFPPGLARALVKRGQRREAFLIGFDRARALSAVSAASACERTALRSAKQQGAIATQSNGVERSRSGD